MKLEKLIIYSLFASVLFASLSLILSAQIHPVHRAGISLGLLVSLFYQVFQWRLNRWFFNSLAILALASSLVYGLWFAEYPIQSAIYFLGYLILIRLFELESPRDYKFTLLLSLFEISAGSLMMVQFRFLIIFFAWLTSALFSLGLITLSSQASGKKIFPAPGRLFSLLFSAGISSLVLGFLLFFFLPRIGFSLISLQLGSDRGFSGYSSEIQLGEVSELLENQTPVLRGKILDSSEPIEGLKWRVRAMEYYENNRWQDRLSQSSTFWISYNQPVSIDPHPPKGKKITQEIFLMPELGIELPSAGWAYAYLLPAKYRFFSCFANNYCVLPYLSSEMFHYLVYSVLPEYSEAEIRQALRLSQEAFNPEESKELTPFLQLPKGSEPICQLAQEIAGSEPDPVKQIFLIQNYFKTKFKYSLKNLPRGKKPLEEFLFKSREGNCEYFASAGVLMLRCLKIPSRLVVGFVAGEWNSYQNYYLVRQSDAHTWVEIYLPGLGFMEFDPTPPGARAQKKTPSWLWQIIDPMVLRWNRWIVDFSVQDQLRGFRRIEAETYRWRYNLNFSRPKIRDWIRSQPMLALGIALLAVLAIFLSFWLRPRQTSEPFPQKNLTPLQKQALKIYLQMFKILKQKGYARTPGMTGLELSEKFPSETDSRKLIQSITDLYYQIRFGKEPLRKENLEKARAELKRLEKTISSSR